MQQTRKQKLEKAKKLKEHYALYKLTTEFIDENKIKQAETEVVPSSSLIKVKLS